MYKYFIFILPFIFQVISAQELPMGYIKYFEAGFTQKKLTEQFHISEHASNELKNGVWYTEERKDSLTSFTPPALFLVDKHVLGDFIASVNIRVSGEQTDSINGIFIVAGMRDSANYYFIQLNDQGAAFYKMYRGQINLIERDSNFILEKETWQNLLITRDILKRTILIQTKKLSVEFSDPNLIMGYLGLGVCNYKLALKSFVIWAPAAISKPATIFR